MLYIKNTCQKEISKRSQFLAFQKHIKINASKLHQFPIKIESKNTPKQRPSKLDWKKNIWKWRRFFSHRNFVKQSTSKWRRFFVHQNYIKKVRWNDVEMYQYCFSKYWNLQLTSWCVPGALYFRAIILLLLVAGEILTGWNTK